MPRPPWTAPIVERLRQLVPLGLSQRELAITINGEFGTFFTRNAIAGQVDRLKLRGGEFRTLRGAPRAPRVQKRRPNNFRRSNKGIEPFVVSGIHEMSPAEYNCSLLELTNITCRWPIGDPHKSDFAFCGAPMANLEEERPYCPYHSRMACNYPIE